jgi:hypothetical protein
MTSNPAVVAAVMVVLASLTLPLAKRLAADEGDPRLFTLVMVSLGLRFLCSLVQVYVVKHAYGGVADFTGYESYGAQIATGLHAGHFSPGRYGVSANGTVNVTVGIIFAIIGDNQIGGFAVFAWIALLGTIAFYRAFRIALPGAERMRYAVLVFLMPSLVFWTADIGKEALMTAFLGVSANGAARLLSRQPGALVRLVAGLGLGTLLRPNESVLVFGALCIAFLIGRARRPGRAGPLGVVAWAALLGVAGFFMLEATVHFLHLHSLSFGGVRQALHRTDVNNTGTGAGYGSSNYRYSPGISHYVQDAYTVLLDPLPVQAHSVTQLLASLENVVVLGILAVSIGRLGTMVRTCLREPYILLCLVYTLAFLYFFASLGNLGLLDRERTLLFPFLFVLVSLPARRRAVVTAPTSVLALR